MNPCWYSFGWIAMSTLFIVQFMVFSNFPMAFSQKYSQPLWAQDRTFDIVGKGINFTDRWQNWFKYLFFLSKLNKQLLPKMLDYQYRHIWQHFVYFLYRWDCLLFLNGWNLFIIFHISLKLPLLSNIMGYFFDMTTDVALVAIVLNTPKIYSTLNHCVEAKVEEFIS